MNALKSLIIGVVILVIGGLLFFWSMGSTIKKVSFNSCIGCQNKQLIDSLEYKITQADSSSKISFDDYLSIRYLINEYERQNIFSIDSTGNSSMAETKSSKLNTSFIDKFVKHTKTTLGKSVWNVGELSKIQSDIRMIGSYSILESGSNFSKDIHDFKTAISDYYAIKSFISSCKSLTYSGKNGKYEIEDKFPTKSIIDDYTKKATTLKGKEYVKNITAFKAELNNIVQYVFDANYRYLKAKIKRYDSEYKYYLPTEINRFSDEVFTPLDEQIKNLSSTEYSSISTRDKTEKIKELTDLRVKMWKY